MIKPGTVAKLTADGPLMTAMRYDLISALSEKRSKKIINKLYNLWN